MAGPQPAAIKYPISPMGVRVRKPTEYQRHYQEHPRALLESGDLLLIEPFDNYGFYLVRVDSIPEVLPWKSINLTTKGAAGGLPALSAGNTSGPSQLIRNLDLFPMELAQYHFIVRDPGYQVIFAQPTAEFRFKDKAGAHPVSYGSTMNPLGRYSFGEIPQLWVFQDDTPIQMQINSTNMNESLQNCRLWVLGYKYQLLRVQVPNPDNEPRSVITLRIGPKQ
jgi:hypothetical protein